MHGGHDLSLDGCYSYSPHTCSGETSSENGSCAISGHTSKLHALLTASLDLVHASSNAHGGAPCTTTLTSLLRNVPGLTLRCGIRAHDNKWIYACHQSTTQDVMPSPSENQENERESYFSISMLHNTEWYSKREM